MEAHSLETPPERDLPTLELIRRAMDETKLLARVEILHAKQEVKEELRAVAFAAALFGAAAAFALCGLALFFVMIALALPVAEPGACAIVGGFLLLGAGACAFVGYKKLPRQPLPQTRRSLQADFSFARERLA